MFNLIKKNEVVDSVNGVAKDRLTSNLYGVFIFSWLAFHWELIYTAFFVSENTILAETGLLRNDYLTQEFFNFSSWTFWVYMIAPFILTWLLIWVLPKHLLIPAFKKGEEDKTEKRKIIIYEQRKLKQEEAKLESEVEKKLIATQKKVQTQKQINKTDPEVLWEEEYRTFRKLNIYEYFSELIESIYENQGQTKIYGRFEVDTDILAYAHSNGLVDFKSSGNRIEFTNKGLYFVKLYSAENQK